MLYLISEENNLFERSWTMAKCILNILLCNNGNLYCSPAKYTINRSILSGSRKDSNGFIQFIDVSSFVYFQSHSISWKDKYIKQSPKSFFLEIPVVTRKQFSAFLVHTEALQCILMYQSSVFFLNCNNTRIDKCIHMNEIAIFTMKPQ